MERGGVFVGSSHWEEVAKYVRVRSKNQLPSVDMIAERITND